MRVAKFSVLLSIFVLLCTSSAPAIHHYLVSSPQLSPSLPPDPPKSAYAKSISTQSSPGDPTVPCHVEKGWNFYSQSREDVAIHNFFCNKTGGTFVELGALDGVTYSNTKFLEDHRQWTGLLIEAQPENAAALKRNRPHSKTMGMAVCQQGVEHLVFTGTAGAVAGSVGTMSPSFRKAWHGKDSAEYQVPCCPIGNMLRDAGISQVDLFSLDVEGAELAVLETMDWNIPVTLWVVELDGHDKPKDQAVRNLLESHGYAKTSWDIRTFCCSGCDCAINETFERRTS